jgi:Mrp family chromosome partitioning ATPase
LIAASTTLNNLTSNKEPQNMEISERQKVLMLSELAEANRMLTGLESLVSRQMPFCCMVTSSAWGEGKTTLTAGLGMIAAKRADKRILAIDMNWYSPGLHQCFGLNAEWDLKGYSQGMNLESLIRPSDVANLDILTAPAPGGNGDSSSAESSGVALGILKQAREAYDVILVDTASVFPTNRRMIDPVVLGNACDAVILLVLTGVTPRQQVIQAHEMLESSGAKRVGVVVNHWKNNL